MSLPKYKKIVDEQLVNKLIFFLQTCKKPKVITKVDKTISSLVANVLLKKALGEKSIAMVFDFGTTETEELIDICKMLGLNTYILKRGSFYQKELLAYRLRKEQDIKDFYKRFTNYHLITCVDHMKAVLIDTVDKSGRLACHRPDGFYGSLVPFYSLYKTEVYELAKFLQIPDQFIHSDDWDYWKKVDPVLFLLTEKQFTPEKIAQEFNIDLAWLKKLKTDIDKQSFKTAVSEFII